MTKIHSSQRTLYAVALAAILLFSNTPEAQALRDGAYGLRPEQVTAGDLPPGWISLVAPNTPLTSGRESHPCSTLAVLEAGLGSSTWPGGIVPFEFNPNVSAANQAIAIGAMAAISPLAQLSFIPRNGESAYLNIIDSTRNFSSSVGFNGGLVQIEVISWGTPGRIMHELLHCLAMFHEQQRPDAATFVTFFPARITAGDVSNFQINPSAKPVGPYDFGSIMHYGTCFFPTCTFAGPCPVGCETLLPTAPFSSFRSQMGQRVALSPLDVHGLRRLYPKPNWRFVDAANSSTGDGTGSNPWQSLATALEKSPAGSTILILPGNYSAIGTWNKQLRLEAPVGGVTLE